MEPDLLGQGCGKEQACDLASLFSKVDRVIGDAKSSGASETLLVFGDLATSRRPGASRKYYPTSAAVKFGFPATWNNGFDVEVWVYRRLVQYLTQWRITPHVMTYVASGECGTHETIQSLRQSASQRTSRSAVAQRLLRSFESYRDRMKSEVKAGEVDGTRMRFLIAERGRGRTLEEWLADPKNGKNAEAVWNIAFQVLFTLEAMRRLGLRHNDLHHQNIWIEDIPNPRNAPNFIYFLDADTYVVLPMKYGMVKIFDWDRAFYAPPSAPSTIRRNPATDLIRRPRGARGGLTDPKAKVATQAVVPDWPKRNTHLDPDYCTLYGQCNEPNGKYDAFTFLHDLYHDAAVSPTVRSWVRTWFGPTRLPAQRSNLRFTTNPRGGATIPGNAKTLLDLVYDPPSSDDPGLRGTLCRLDAKGGCRGDYKPTDEEMAPLYEILYDGFEDWSRKLPKFDPRYDPVEYQHIFSLPGVKLDAAWESRFDTFMNRSQNHVRF